MARRTEPALSDETPNGLALEYQRDYGTAHRDLDIADLVNNPAANGVCRVLGLGFQEQPVDLFARQLRDPLGWFPEPCSGLQAESEQRA